jgi:hypothetical protein
LPTTIMKGPILESCGNQTDFRDCARAQLMRCCSWRVDTLPCFMMLSGTPAAGEVFSDNNVARHTIATAISGRQLLIGRRQPRRRYSQIGDGEKT